MGREALGRFLISTAEIPAASDASVFFPLFSAPGVPVEIQYVQWYGGDAGEFLQLLLIPPTVVTTAQSPSDIPGTIAITNKAYMSGAYATIDNPAALGSNDGGRGSPRFEPFIVPPNYQICMMQNTGNAAAWSCTVGGFELVQGW